MNNRAPHGPRFVNLDEVQRQCPIPELLHKLGLGAHATPSCPSPLRKAALLSSIIIGRQRLIPREAVLVFEQAGLIAQCETPGATNGGDVQ